MYVKLSVRTAVLESLYIKSQFGDICFIPVRSLVELSLGLWVIPPELKILNCGEVPHILLWYRIELAFAANVVFEVSENRYITQYFEVLVSGFPILSEPPKIGR